jgi:hypothetical protein
LKIRQAEDEAAEERRRKKEASGTEYYRRGKSGISTVVAAYER